MQTYGIVIQCHRSTIDSSARDRDGVRHARRDAERRRRVRGGPRAGGGATPPHTSVAATNLVATTPESDAAAAAAAPLLRPAPALGPRSTAMWFAWLLFSWTASRRGALPRHARARRRARPLAQEQARGTGPRQTCAVLTRLSSGGRPLSRGPPVNTVCVCVCLPSQGGSPKHARLKSNDSRSPTSSVDGRTMLRRRLGGGSQNRGGGGAARRQSKYGGGGGGAASQRAGSISVAAAVGLLAK